MAFCLHSISSGLFRIHCSEDPGPTSLDASNACLQSACGVSSLSSALSSYESFLLSGELIQFIREKRAQSALSYHLRLFLEESLLSFLIMLSFVGEGAVS